MWIILAESGWQTEIQPQFWVSVVRLGFLVASVGAFWMLWNSDILTERKRNAALVAGMVHFLFAVIVDLGLVYAGKYKYAFDELMFMGVPLDIQFGYACIWGTGLCLLWENAWIFFRPLLFISAVVLTVLWDQWGLTTGKLFVSPAPDWKTWNIIVHCALPIIAITFFKLVEENRAVILRSVIYALGYFIAYYFVIPSVILSSSFGQPLLASGRWQEVGAALLLASMPGAWAAGQFAISGRGTPLPLDPTHKLIITGPYAYVRNPMQISLVGVSAVWAFVTQSYALWGYVVVLVLLMQLFRIYEEDGLHGRFGERYKKYTNKVWLWLPRLTPYEEETEAPSSRYRSR